MPETEIFYADTRQDARNYKKEMKEMPYFFVDLNKKIYPDKAKFTAERRITLEEQKELGLSRNHYWCFYVIF